MFTFNNKILLFNNRITDTVYVAPAFDADAQAFITAANIADLTQQNAINQFVIDLKGFNLWTKFHALYPYVGGSAASHSYNLKNPAQYQITWFGGLTHDANGVTGNGTTGYGKTGLFIGSLTYNNTALHTYIRNNTVTTSAYDLGGFSGTPRLIFGARVSTIGSSQQYNTTVGGGRIDFSTAAAVGMWTATRPLSNVHKVLKNGVVFSSNTGTSIAPSNVEIYVRAINNNNTSAANHNPRNSALDAISDGFNDTEALNFYTAVQTYQTTLGRNV